MTQSSLVKNIHGSIGAESGILAHSVPHDIVVASQRQRILEAMAECCAEKTFADTTISDIVGRAGVSRRTFYKLFANKRDCFEAAINSFAEEIPRIVAAGSSEASWPDRVRKTIAEILGRLAAKPAFANLALVEAVGVDPALVNRYWDPLIEAMSRSPEEREGEPPISAARAAVGAAQVLIAQKVSAGRGEQLPELLPDLVYIALVPFVGQEEALEQVRLAR
jgi:AcrR family transcriptional regulator